MENGITTGEQQPALSVWQVLEEETALLDGNEPLAHDHSWLFEEIDLLRDPNTGEVLLEKCLKDPANVLSQYLWQACNCREEEWQTLAPEEKTRKLTDALNSLACDSHLYRPERFPNAMLTDEIVHLLGCHLQGADLIYRNRLLLERAYPGALCQVGESLTRRLHQKNRAALCFSGGGIRSATFNLGVLQALAQYGFLGNFHYLSTVSGGGYIGGWFTAWVHRHKQGLQGVLDELKSLRRSQIDPEHFAIRHLREHSNYLTPRWGLLSADTWTWVAIYVRNLLLNWSVLIPLFAALLLLPRFAVTVVQLQIPSVWQWLVLGLGTFCAVFAIAYVDTNLPSQKKLSRDQSHFLLYCLLPLCGAAIALTTWWSWLCNTPQAEELPGPVTFMLFGMGVHVIGSSLAAAFRLYQAWRQPEEALSPQERKRQPPLEILKELLVALPFVIVAGVAGGVIVWWAATSPLFQQPRQFSSYYVCFAAPLLLTLFLIATALYIGFASRQTSDEDREWWARAGGWTLIAIVGWGVASWLVLVGPQVFLDLGVQTKTALGALGGVSGLFTLVMGHSQNTQAREKRGNDIALSDTLKNLAFSLATPLFAVFLIGILSLGVSKLIAEIAKVEWIATALAFRIGNPALTLSTMHELVVQTTPLTLLCALFLLAAAVGVFMGRYININKFSLHSAYRDRLIRAYLGASHLGRNPNQFTGFDPQDNIQMFELQKSPHTQRFEKPLHVVNIALNLVRGGRLAWQERKAESFTVTPLHAGSYRLRYRRSREYGGRKDIDGKTEGISLGTAVTISGAAASPNSGYHSSPVVTFLMALFNVRLGWWLGNPGPAGDQVFRQRGPDFAVRPLLEETFGLTTDMNKYVYLSDGGHFENLGLYEMVLRRCHCIIVVDAGCDPECKLEDLGNAIRKIRADLGISVEFREGDFPIYSREGYEKVTQAGKTGKRFSIATIHYKEIDGEDKNDGVLLYLKPALYGDEPIDIGNYAATSETFPHETTADQWFTESQFESYRMLGMYTVEETVSALSEDKPQELTFDGFVEQARRYGIDRSVTAPPPVYRQRSVPYRDEQENEKVL
jgi:hypothetical protein